MKNVVLLTIDALRKDALGCYGSQLNLTPNLDELARRSLVYTNHISAGSYTQASFPGILTSSYFLEFGEPKRLSDRRTVVCEVVKRGGFTTAAFHSNPYLSAYFGWSRGWDVFYDSMKDQVSATVPYIKGDAVNQKAADWLAGYTKSPGYKQFFLWLHYMDVHEPYVPAQKYIDKVDSSIDLSPAQMLELFTEVLLQRDVSDAVKIELLRKLYLAQIAEIDEYAGNLFEILERLGLQKNTIVIVTTDHGDEFGEHGGLSHDGKFYSELINVPLIIYDPAVERGEVVNTIVSGVDFAPTICHLFGLPAAPSWHGQSLLPVEDYVSRGAFGEAVGKLTHKIRPSDRPVHFYQEGSLRISHRTEGDVWQLYNLQTDPAEKNNVIGIHAQAESMKGKLRSHITWWDVTDEPVFRVTKF
jgi:arylsulfatase A-like enzyme